jgi:hypothetical protein
MPGTYFKKGSHNIICDVCGGKFKFSEVRKRWDGLIVCANDFETDHPQKYIRVRESGLAVPVIRDRPEDVFTFVCDPWTSSGYADFTTADCAKADGTGISIERLIELFKPATSSIAAIAIAGYSIAGVT